MSEYTTMQVKIEIADALKRIQRQTAAEQDRDVAIRDVVESVLLAGLDALGVHSTNGIYTLTKIDVTQS